MTTVECADMGAITCLGLMCGVCGHGVRCGYGMGCGHGVRCGYGMGHGMVVWGVVMV